MGGQAPNLSSPNLYLLAPTDAPVRGFWLPTKSQDVFLRFADATSGKILYASSTLASFHHIVYIYHSAEIDVQPPIIRHTIALAILVVVAGHLFLLKQVIFFSKVNDFLDATPAHTFFYVREY